VEEENLSHVQELIEAVNSEKIREEKFNYVLESTEIILEKNIPQKVILKPRRKLNFGENSTSRKIHWNQVEKTMVENQKNEEKMLQTLRNLREKSEKSLKKLERVSNLNREIYLAKKRGELNGKFPRNFMILPPTEITTNNINSHLPTEKFPKTSTSIYRRDPSLILPLDTTSLNSQITEKSTSENILENSEQPGTILGKIWDNLCSFWKILTLPIFNQTKVDPKYQLSNGNGNNNTM
jgi:hypothetical protein